MHKFMYIILFQFWSLAKASKQRFSSYLSEGPYELFRVEKPSENSFINSLLDLLECEDDCLTVSVFKLLFAIFHAEEAVFSSAQSTYIYSDFSVKVSDWMLKLSEFSDYEKILLRMLQGCVQGKQTDTGTSVYRFVYLHFFIADKIHCYKGDKSCKN